MWEVGSVLMAAAGPGLVGGDESRPGWTRSFLAGLLTAHSLVHASASTAFLSTRTQWFGLNYLLQRAHLVSDADGSSRCSSPDGCSSSRVAHCPQLIFPVSEVQRSLKPY